MHGYYDHIEYTCHCYKLMTAIKVILWLKLTSFTNVGVPLHCDGVVVAIIEGFFMTLFPYLEVNKLCEYRVVNMIKCML